MLCISRVVLLLKKNWKRFQIDLHNQKNTSRTSCMTVLCVSTWVRIGTVTSWKFVLIHKIDLSQFQNCPVTFIAVSDEFSFPTPVDKDIFSIFMYCILRKSLKPEVKMVAVSLRKRYLPARQLTLPHLKCESSVIGQKTTLSVGRKAHGSCSVWMSRSRQGSPYPILWRAQTRYEHQGSARSATGSARRKKKRRERSDHCRGRTAHIMSVCGWLWNDKHSSDLCRAVSNVTIRWHKMNGTMHIPSVHDDALCVKLTLGDHVVIGVGRAIVQRHHANITNYWILTLELLVQLCTWSQTVCFNRQIFPIAIYCTLFYLENGSFEVLCLHSEDIPHERGTVEVKQSSRRRSGR